MKKAEQLPILIEKDEDGFYVVECPVFSGCYSQGRTMDEALENIREVIALCLEEKENQKALHNFHPQELSFHTFRGLGSWGKDVKKPAKLLDPRRAGAL